MWAAGGRRLGSATPRATFPGAPGSSSSSAVGTTCMVVETLRCPTASWAYTSWTQSGALGRSSPFRGRPRCRPSTTPPSCSTTRPCSSSPAVPEPVAWTGPLGRFCPCTCSTWSLGAGASRGRRVLAQPRAWATQRRPSAAACTCSVGSCGAGVRALWTRLCTCWRLQRRNALRPRPRAPTRRRRRRRARRRGATLRRQQPQSSRRWESLPWPLRLLLQQPRPQQVVVPPPSRAPVAPW
mmetsp:Transcript_51637/g.161977  ORF Transcript_51637/g.161977 Transcript_51637/m.161977 type:complete len:239 (-) Transcript_51637:345-1061(-)